MTTPSKGRAAVVLAGVALGGVAIYALSARSASAPAGTNPDARAAGAADADAARSADVPDAARPLAVAAAYGAWLAGEGRAKAMWREIVRDAGGKVLPGLPAGTAVVVAQVGTGVLVRGAASEAGTMLADGESGAIVAWIPQGRHAFAGDGFGAFLFEETGEERATVFDAKTKRLLGDVLGLPLAGSSDASVVVYTRASDPDHGHGSIVRLWNAGAGQDRGALRFEGDAATPPSLGVSMTGEVAVVSDDGRFVAALVEEVEARVVVWNATTGAVVATQPLTRPELAARFSPDGRRLYAIAAAPGRAEDVPDEGLIAVDVTSGVVDGPRLGCNTARAPLGSDNVAVSMDGKLVAVGGAVGACVYSTGPLRLAWKTQALQAAPAGEDVGFLSPTFVLDGLGLLVGTTGPAGWALFRTSDHALLAKGPVFEAATGSSPATSVVSPSRVVLMLEPEAGPVLVDVDGSASAKRRPLTPAEQRGDVQPPEIVSTAAGDARGSRQARARAAIDKRVCHAGPIIIPTEMCD